MSATTVFERACRGQAVPHTPVWIMRQAGRYLPEYRALRSTVDFLTATRTPEIAARITLQPMERFPLDAAILFSDIMTPLEGMGVPVDFDPGPVLSDPVRSPAHVARLRELDPDEGTPFVQDAVGLVRSELRPEAALIGFAGAPFTLFCYLVEGGGSKDFMTARRFLREESRAAGTLLDLLGRSMARYLAAQAEAGADALMLFDSWVGLLAPDDYRRLVLPVLERTLATLRERTSKPVIYFAHGGATLLPDVRGLGADVVGIDWTLPLSSAVSALGSAAVVQGNLDPSLLFAPHDVLGPAIDRVLDEGRAAAGHVFNLGHGISRETDPDQVAFLVDRVHQSSARSSTDAVPTREESLA
jgi:uroporphyrinogen decarboxylase